MEGRFVEAPFRRLRQTGLQIRIRDFWSHPAPGVLVGSVSGFKIRSDPDPGFKIWLNRIRFQNLVGSGAGRSMKI